jgi:hypothetical protein
MKFFFKYCLLVLFMCFLAVACRQEDKAVSEDFIVSLNGNTLTSQEVSEVIPQNIPEKDSTELAEKYIQKWINSELLFRSAVKSLNDSTSIQKKVNAYRKQMYIYEYENQYVRAELDTVVAYDEVQAYYDNNMMYYLLERPAVKAHYMIMDSEIPAYYREIDKVRRARPGKMDILYDAIKGTNKTIVEHNERWIYFDELQKEINAVNKPEIQQEAFQKGYFAVEDSIKRYLVKINDVLMPGDTMPVDLIEKNISQIIINKRKQELITNLKNQLLQDAKSDGDIVINEN